MIMVQHKGEHSFVLLAAPEKFDLFAGRFARLAKAEGQPLWRFVKLMDRILAESKAKISASLIEHHKDPEA